MWEWSCPTKAKEEVTHSVANKDKFETLSWNLTQDIFTISLTFLKHSSFSVQIFIHFHIENNKKEDIL